jgi:hypothetical protein
MLETIGLLIFAATFWLWYDGLKAREAGVRASRAACVAEDLLFLDDTVSIDSMWPARDAHGQLRWRRVYAFEYSDTGNNRRKGNVTLIGDSLIAIYLAPRSEQPPSFH